MMLTAYCDDAGGKDHNFTIICGYISTIEQWESFEIDWKLFLASYGVSYLHMKEFTAYSGPFAKWKGKESIRRRFLKDASVVI
ncbi:MAG TPA: hypothetical protein VLW54_05570, partial [Candidatus Acidoferrales bacterium]|nr:hypothetical protein [Candidatus Acidoferrales bacterium]